MKNYFIKKASFFFSAAFLCATQLLSQAPAFQWVNQGYPHPGGTAPQVKAGAIAIDASGNSYVTGTFVGRTVFGKGVDTLVLNGYDADPNNDLGDMYLAKYDNTGKVLWVREGLNRQHHGAPIAGTGVAVDLNNNIYITGYYGDSISFGATKLAGSGNTQDYTCSYLTKYDAAGNLLWAKTAGTGIIYATGLTVDGAGNTYLAGTARFAAISTATYSGIGSAVFIAKYDNNGNARWAVNPGYNGVITGKLACSGNGLFYTGYTGSNIVISKTDTAGASQWVQGSSNTTTNGSVIAADNAGNCYLGGSFRSSLAFGTTSLSIAPGNTSQQDGFLIKFNGAGAIQWSKSFVATSNNDNDITGICTDNAGGLYISGMFSYQTNFGASTIPANNLSPVGGFVAKFNTSGTNQWATYTSTHGGVGIVADATGPYFIGSFQYQATFGSLTIMNPSFSPAMYVTKMGATTGIGAFDEDVNDVIVFPNPAADQVNIALADNMKNARIEVLSATGQVIYPESSYIGSSAAISCEGWAKGIYFVKVSTDKARKIMKLIVQ